MFAHVTPRFVCAVGSVLLVVGLLGCDGDLGTVIDSGGSDPVIEGGDGHGDGDPSSSLAGTTTLTSTSLAGSGASARTGMGDPPEDEFIGYQITPDNVTGQVLSLLFATDGQDDEGLVIFGDTRPDIAPADSDLIDFDLEAPEPIQSSILLKPNFVGGTSSLFVMLFGYMDMHFTLSSQPYVVRIALAEIDDMMRGDKLLLDEASGTYQWYDLDTSSFTSTRPSNPAVIENIRDFADPIRPELVFYPINAEVLEPVDVITEELEAADSIDVVLDFVLIDALVLVGEVDPTSVDTATLITTLDLTQNAFDTAGGGFAESGFIVAAEVELTPAP